MLRNKKKLMCLLKGIKSSQSTNQIHKSIVNLNTNNHWQKVKHGSILRNQNSN